MAYFTEQSDYLDYSEIMNKGYQGTIVKLHGEIHEGVFDKRIFKENIAIDKDGIHIGLIPKDISFRNYVLHVCIPYAKAAELPYEPEIKDYLKLYMKKVTPEIAACLGVDHDIFVRLANLE